MPSPKKMRAK